MSINNRRLAVLVAGVMGVAGVVPVSAELPVLQEKDFLGYFVGVKSRKYFFGVTGQGKTMIQVLGKNGSPMSQALTVNIDFQVEETMPDGKVISRKIQPGSLESAQPATSKPQDVVIRGKVTGDAAFEIYVSEARGGVSVGGRLVDKGTIKNPARFSIAVKIPDVYAKTKKTGDKKTEKAFEEKTKNDLLRVVMTDKKRNKVSLVDSLDAASPEISGPGLSEVELELGAYAGAVFNFSASPNSSMTLSNDAPGPLRDGFSIIWTADSQKDAQGKARLEIGLK